MKTSQIINCHSRVMIYIDIEIILNLEFYMEGDGK